MYVHIDVSLPCITTVSVSTNDIKLSGNSVCR